MENCLIQIDRQYASFSAVEKKIAGFIRENPEKVIHMTTALLSETIGVSEGSIINFSNMLGFKGFSRLKLHLAQNLPRNEETLFDGVDSGDTPKSALGKMIVSSTRAFQSTYAAIDNSELQKAADLIKSARRIEIYGVGSSSMVADDIYYRFMRMGYPAYAVTDPHIAAVSASHMGEGCLAIGVSHSGRTVETVKAVELAKASGAVSIALTSYGDSPLAALCDVSLLCVSQEAALYKEAVVSRLTQLLIFDALCLYLSCQNKEDSLAHMGSLTDILGTYRK